MFNLARAPIQIHMCITMKWRTSSRDLCGFCWVYIGVGRSLLFHGWWFVFVEIQGFSRCLWSHDTSCLCYHTLQSSSLINNPKCSTSGLWCRDYSGINQSCFQWAILMEKHECHTVLPAIPDRCPFRWSDYWAIEDPIIELFLKTVEF